MRTIAVPTPVSTDHVDPGRASHSNSATPPSNEDTVVPTLDIINRIEDNMATSSTWPMPSRMSNGSYSNLHGVNVEDLEEVD